MFEVDVNVYLFHGHTFGEVSWLIDVQAPRHSDVVRQELEGYDGEEGRQRHNRFRHLDITIDHAFHLTIALGDDGGDAALAGDDLLHVGDDFLVELVVRR